MKPYTRGSGAVGLPECACRSAGLALVSVPYPGLDVACGPLARSSRRASGVAACSSTVSARSVRSASPDVGRLHRRLVDRVQRLSRHVGALHEVHEPWGLTPFAVQSALLGIPATARTPFRLPAPERLDGEAAETLRDELREFAHLRGFTLRPSSTPWYGALLRTGADAQQMPGKAS